MTAWTILLGEAELSDFIPGHHSAWREAFHEAAIILGIILSISAIIFIWAVWLRRKPRRRKHHQHRHITVPESTGTPAPDGTGTALESGPGGSGRRRHSRHKTRPMNRTLAETKGLPPVRDGQTPPRGL